MNRLAHETLVSLRRSLQGLPASAKTEASIAAIGVQIDHLHEHAAGELIRSLDDLWIGMLGAGMSNDGILQAFSLVAHQDDQSFLDGVDLPSDIAALYRAATSGLAIVAAPSGADLNALNANALSALDAYYGAPFLGLAAHFERLGRFSALVARFGEAFGRVHLGATRPRTPSEDILAAARVVAPHALLGLLTDSWLYLDAAHPAHKPIALPAHHGVRKAEVEVHATRHGLDPDACWQLVRLSTKALVRGALIVL